MGKKVISQASLKISKFSDKKQLNSLVKALRPKVYITDSSSFKKLVQELTGNGESIPLPPPSKPPLVEKITTSDVVEDRESSLETSFDASVDSFEFFAQVSSPEELNQSRNQIYFSDTASDPFLIRQQADPIAFQDFDSSFLDVDDQHPFCSSYSQFHREEVSIYDYELSELL